MTWLRLHGIAFAEAVRRLLAQPLASLVSIVVLATAIALPVMAAIALRSLGTVTAGIDTDPHVNVYLAIDATDEDARRVEQALRGHADAAAVRFIPRAEALAELKATTHLAEILATLDRNPLPHAFTVRVRSTATDRVQAMRAEWARLPKVEQVLADFEWSGRLGRWVRFGDRALLVAWILLGTAIAFIVGHLIRLQVLTHREEIEVSQLVGATAADVRRPFLYHGTLQGLAAAGVALAGAALLATWVGHELSALTPTYASELKVVFIPPMEAGIVALIAASLGFLGAWLAVSRELRQFGTGK